MKANRKSSERQVRPAAVPAAAVASGPEADRVDSAAEQTREEIAVAAYFRAEKRGFAPGREIDDWLAAEAERRSGRE